MDPQNLDTLDRVPHGGASDPQLLDFSANTNPASPTGAATVYESAFSAARQYPVDDYCEFRAAAAEYIGVSGRQIIPAPGGLAGMRLLLSVVIDDGDSVAIPAPSFGEYAKEVQLQGGEPTFVDHDEIQTIDPEPHELVIVCNPNNPTGTAYCPMGLRALADRCRDAGTTLLVDEAFLDFTDEPSLAGTEGVVVARSLTKIFGLPGLRAGFLVATGQLRERLDVARLSWTLSTPAAAVGAHCLGETEFVEETRQRVEAERQRMAERLSERFTVTPSEAPFLLLETDEPVAEIIDEARSAGIVIRDATTFRGLDSHVRVAIKRDHENDQLLEALGV
ncbi:threonine-phosphate decarboxylase [Halohasta litorea]|uniref:Aminotransferase n=1 Tax=Halohasta litorea TaxID=869891 RepID=A0ABD6DC45_9EURY|nr:threonine-phosphate decarboxylase [Halohasta litorea]